MADAVLTINAGSSSIKFALFELRPDGPACIAHGEVENIGAAPHLRIKTEREIALEKRWPDDAILGHEDLLIDVLAWVDTHLGGDRLIAAGHRIVHGGTDFTAPTLLTEPILARLAGLNQLAPLHEPHNLAAVQAIFVLRPGLPQIGCFDTAFHHTMPDIATRLALPRSFHEQGVRRYGFHGLSYEYIAGQLLERAPHLAQGRVIVAHLGNGASLCALKNGVSLDSSMGFTALEGLMMGTRCGSIDPGVLLYFAQARGMSADDITTLLYKKSGLLGVSGTSADVRTLLADPSPQAAEALDLFTYSIARHAGALISILGGLDGFIFTAGIGEHAAPIRAAICHRLAWAGLDLSPEANNAHEPAISTPNSQVEIRIIPTNEELIIAQHIIVVLGAGVVADV